MRFFPHETLEWRTLELSTLRRLSLSLVGMAVLAGIVLRIYRLIALRATAPHPVAYVIAFVIGLALLAGFVTLHLGNYPLRKWIWRAPAFALVDATAELATSAVFVAFGLERIGSVAMGWAQWSADILPTITRVVILVCAYALMLASAVQIVRRIIAGRAVREARRDGIIIGLFIVASLLVVVPARQAQERPFGTLREQADVQQRWLATRLETVLPELMRKYGIDFWVVPMREYNEDPVFTSLVSPTTFAARRRTIYVFHDRGPGRGVDRIALGGTSQGGVYTAVRSTKPVDAPAGGGGGGGNANARTAELWGDAQWQVLRDLVEERKPTSIGINISRTHAFADGLSAGEYEGMSAALGPAWTARFKRVEGLAVDLIATRIPEEVEVFERMNRLVWEIVRTAFSNQVITPGVTRTDDVVWWMRQRVNDLGLGSWFQPSVSVQRRGVPADSLGPNPVIERGDVLHCDFGIVAMRLTTDTQHMGYVLREGEADVPAGIKAALRNSNRLQDIVMEEIRPGRTGNEILRSSLEKMRAAGIDGTVYTHPIGMHGHGAGPLIGLWDYQDGVPGRGDHRVIPGMWFSIELQATTPVAEWGGQPVRSAQEEDMVIGADGRPRWAVGRQSEYHIVR